MWHIESRTQMAEIETLKCHNSSCNIGWDPCYATSVYELLGVNLVVLSDEVSIENFTPTWSHSEPEHLKKQNK